MGDFHCFRCNAPDIYAIYKGGFYCRDCYILKTTRNRSEQKLRYLLGELEEYEKNIEKNIKKIIKRNININSIPKLSE
jgi:late competence protein required for DNA uptake (superfamily II DNA/RNA helicase)